MLKKRGQISNELMVVLAIVLVIIAFIITVNQEVMTGVEGEYDARKAKIALDRIVQAGKLVYQQGEGAQTKIFVSIPPNVESITISGRTISLLMNISGEPNDIYRITDYNITGNLSRKSGNYWIKLKSEQKYVNITNYYTYS